MSLSVVVPNFNHASLLPRALTALVRQTPAPTEIIVVDDGSTDDSVSVAQAFAREHRSVRVLCHATNQGAPAAHVTGLAAASGEFVYFAAADDFALPGLFAAAMAALRAHPQAAFFCARVVLIDRAGHVAGFRPFLPPASGPQYLSPSEVRRTMRVADNWAVGPSVIYRRAAVLAAGGIDVTLGSLCDGILVRNLAFRYGCVFDPKTLAAWEVYPESLSARTALSVTKSLEAIALAERAISETFPDDVQQEYRRVFTRRLRFNMARLWLMWGNNRPTIRPLTTLLDLRRVDERILSALSYLPGPWRKLMLAWIALRTRPFGFTALLHGWWDAQTHNKARRHVAQHIVDQTFSQ